MQTLFVWLIIWQHEFTPCCVAMECNHKVPTKKPAAQPLSQDLCEMGWWYLQSWQEMTVTLRVQLVPMFSIPERIDSGIDLS